MHAFQVILKGKNVIKIDSKRFVACSHLSLFLFLFFSLPRTVTAWRPKGCNAAAPLSMAGGLCAGTLRVRDRNVG